MSGANGKTVLEKEALPAIDFTQLVAYSIASAGAMGDAGGIRMLMRDGTLYYFNFFESNIQPEEFKRLVGAAGLDGFQNLGMGNVLFFRAEDAGWLLEKRDRYLDVSDRYERGNPRHERIVLYKKWIDFYREHIAETDSCQKHCEEDG